MTQNRDTYKLLFIFYLAAGPGLHQQMQPIDRQGGGGSLIE